MGKTFPMLMVEKTVPAGSYVLTGATTVLDVISADLADATKDTTLFSPGGVIDVTLPTSSSLDLFSEPNLFIGDNTGGIESDIELDESTCPNNYTPPNDATAKPNTTPQNVSASHTNLVHDSVFNKLAIEAQNSSKTSTLITAADGTERRAVSATSSGTGVFDIGSTSGNTNLYELFDIIDFKMDAISNARITIVVQPSNKIRTNQLSKMRSSISNS